METQTVTLIFTIVTAVGVLLQALILLGVLLLVRKTQQGITKLTDHVGNHAVPVLQSTRRLIDELNPKVRTIASNLVDTSATLRTQAEQMKTVVDDVSSRTRQQTARVDGMVTVALNNIANATAAVEKGFAGPLRQVSGVLNGLRAGVEKLRASDAAGSKRVAAIPRPVPSVEEDARLREVFHMQERDAVVSSERR